MSEGLALAEVLGITFLPGIVLWFVLLLTVRVRSIPTRLASAGLLNAALAFGLAWYVMWFAWDGESKRVADEGLATGAALIFVATALILSPFELAVRLKRK